MAKAPHAFRSISEVAATLGVPQHTLRAWEIRFPFVKPVKRADGRRYYRPSDIEMLIVLDRRLKEQALSTEDIVRLHKAGGLAAHPARDHDEPWPLAGHLDALRAARARLAALL